MAKYLKYKSRGVPTTIALRYVCKLLCPYVMPAWPNRAADLARAPRDLLTNPRLPIEFALANTRFGSSAWGQRPQAHKVQNYIIIMRASFPHNT